MTNLDYKTMRVPEDDWKAAREAKAGDETWGEYLLRCAEAEPDTGIDAEEFADKIAARLAEMSD